MKYEFFYYGEPVAQGRPRFNRHTGFAYDPQKSRDYKEALRAFAQEKLQANNGKQLQGSLRMILVVSRSCPASWSNKKKQQAYEGTIAPTTRPDLDNYIKGVLDAISGVLMADDSQITYISATKCYSVAPGVFVEIKEEIEA